MKGNEMEDKKETILCAVCGTFNSEQASWCRVCGEKLDSSCIRILPPGTVLDQGRYWISGYLGHGGSAITYRAKQRNFTAEIAVREYYPSAIARRDASSLEVTAAGPEAELLFDQGKTQFLNEGNNLRDLGRIQSLVQVHDVFEDHGTVYMVEDLISGESLEEILERRKKLTFREAMDYMEPVMRALMEVHSHGLIHRDIKPSNIMISGGASYLIDFGISKRMTRNTTISNHSVDRQKETFSSFTRGYAAPEQITGQAREAAWTDVYGIAATLYRMVTGNEPDDSEARLVRDLLPPPVDLDTDLTREQSDAIMTGLALDTITRFQNMQAFLAALNAREAVPVSRKENPDDSGAEITRKKKIWIWAAAGIILLLMILVLLKWRDRLPFWGSEESNDQDQDQGETEETEENVLDETEEQETASAEETVPVQAVQEAESPAVIDMNVRVLDSQKEALNGYHVRVTQIFTGSEQNGNTRFLYNGQTDSFGWLPTVEAEDVDSFIRFELQESGNIREISLKDIAAAGGQADLSFPFHLYPETRNYGGHTYAVGNLYDASGLSTYNDVEAYCERLGGHLAVINNAGEDAFLYDYACIPGVSTAFFGYTDQDSEGNWKWVFGSSDYTNWTKPGGVHPGPDNGNGASGWGPENYAEYNCGDNGANDGSWNDAKFAVNTSSFIIEWEFERPDKY